MCAGCEKRLAGVAAPDPFRNKKGSTGGAAGPQRAATTAAKLIASRRMAHSFAGTSRGCEMCGARTALDRNNRSYALCQTCAYAKGLCPMCGRVKVLDVSMYRQSEGAGRVAAQEERRRREEMEGRGEERGKRKLADGGAAGAGDADGTTTTTKKKKKKKTEDDAAAAPRAEEEAATRAGGWEFDEASGYHYDPASGYYFDARSKMYFHASAGEWLTEPIPIAPS